MKTTVIKRIQAYLIDLCILGVVLFVLRLFSNPIDINDKINALNSDYILGNITFNEFVSSAGEIYKEVDRSNVWINIFSIVYILLYFVVLPYYNKGQTIGKKILNIKVRSMGNKKASAKQLFLRSLIITGLFYLILTLISLFLPFNYFILISVFGLLQIMLVFICTAMVIIRKDRRGFHDLISGTRVLNTK